MKRKITITNETTWSTRDLRRFATRIAREALPERWWLEHPRGPSITFKYTRPAAFRKAEYSSGWAYLNSRTCVVRLGKAEVDKVDLAHTIAHEFGHLRGMNHSDMEGGAYWMRTGRWREIFAWAEALPLRRKEEPRPPSRTERVDARRVRLAARLEAWRSKERRARNAIRRITRQIRAIDRRRVMVAVESQPAETPAS